MLDRSLRASVYRARMLRFSFGIVGAVAALVYWRLAVFVNPLPLAVLLSAEWRAIGAYAIAGFLLGWALGFAIAGSAAADIDAAKARRRR